MEFDLQYLGLLWESLGAWRLLVAVPVVVIVLAFRFPPRQVLHGSARWMTLWKLMRKGMLRRKGFYLGGYGPGRIGVYFRRKCHVLTIGPPGSSKTVGCSMPHAMSDTSMIMADPGGQNAAVCSKGWRKRKLKGGCYNPRGLHAGPPWNLPSDGIDIMKYLRPARPGFKKRCRLMAGAFFRATGREKGSEQFFKKAAKRRMAAVLADGAIQGQKFDWVVRVLTSSIEGQRRYFAQEMDYEGESAWIEDEARNYFTMLDNAPEQFQAIFDEVGTGLEEINDPELLESLSRDDLDLEKILKGNTPFKLCFILGNDEWRDNSMVIQVCLLACSWVLRDGQKPKQRIDWLIEEFANLGPIGFMKEMLAMGRKDIGNFHIVTQSEAQCEAVYGPDWKAMKGQFEIRRYLAVRDEATAKELEYILGYETRLDPSSQRGGKGKGKVYVKRSLRQGPELWRDEKDYTYILAGNLDPIRLHSDPYWNLPEFSGRYHPDPFEGGSPPVDALKELRKLWAGVAKLAAFFLAPHPAAMAGYAGLVAVGIFATHG